jgi:hypothetical protein
MGAAAGAIVFGLLHYWTGFIFFAVATLLATAQLVRIGMRSRPTSGTGRRW